MNLIKRTTVPSLLDLALRVIIRNLDSLGEIGDIPQNIKNRILEHARPDQLKRIEDCNIYKNLNTEHIWKSFCIKARIITADDELEDESMTWRDFYEQYQDTEKAKLKEIGTRLKKGFIKEKQEKQSKQIVVITPTAVRKTAASRNITSRGISKTTSKPQTSTGPGGILAKKTSGNLMKVALKNFNCRKK